MYALPKIGTIKLKETYKALLTENCFYILLIIRQSGVKAKQLKYVPTTRLLNKKVVSICQLNNYSILLSFINCIVSYFVIANLHLRILGKRQKQTLKSRITCFFKKKETSK